MYRVVVSDMWTKNVNDQNDDFEFWVLAQDQTTFDDQGRTWTTWIKSCEPCQIPDYGLCLYHFD